MLPSSSFSTNRHASQGVVEDPIDLTSDNDDAALCSHAEEECSETSSEDPDLRARRRAGNETCQQQESKPGINSGSHRKRKNSVIDPGSKRRNAGTLSSKEKEEEDEVIVISEEPGQSEVPDPGQNQVAEATEQSSNFRYEGETQNGKWHGQGSITWSDGTVVSGIFQAGKYPSKGKMTDCNGFQYVGELRGLEFHGKGVVTWGSGKAEYDGDFKRGQFHGQGRHVWDDGAVYIGAWENGKREGQGFCTFADGSTYDGQWANDQLHGQGVISIPGNRTYTGEFCKGFPTKGSLKIERGNKEKYLEVTYDGCTAVGGNPRWWISPPWAPTAPRLAPLLAGSDEFLFVSKLFLDDFPPMHACHQYRVRAPEKILQIERVQNENLRTMYETKLNMVRSKCARSNFTGPPEKWLFHSPSAGDALTFIAEEGFTPLLSGTRNGEIHGMGTYFAVKPWKAVQYAMPDRGTGLRRTMLCKVAVGEAFRGQAGMRVPPVNVRAGAGQRFDSLSDDPHNPAIFVVQDNASAYPAYVITYK